MGEPTVIKSHAFCSKEPVPEGGSVIAKCGEPIVKSHWLAFYEDIEDPTSPRFPYREITCQRCRFEHWTGYVYAVIEAQEYEQLKAKGRISDAE